MNKLRDRSIDPIQRTDRKKVKEKMNSLTVLWDIIKHTDICMYVPDR